VGLRIAFYSSHVPASEPEPSGDRTQARSLIAALEEQGHQVQVVSEFRAKFFWLHWHLLRQLPVTLMRTWGQTRGFRPDVWLTLCSERDVPDALGPLITGLARIPYVIYKAPYKNLHAKPRPGRPPGNWSRLPGHLLNRIAILRARNVIVNKHWDFEQYRQDPRVSSKLSLLLPAVSTADFKPDRLQRSRTRLALSIPDDRCVVLSASRLSDRVGRKEKSVRFLIDCISELLATGSKVHLVVAGDGASRAALEHHAKKLGQFCTFLGNVDGASMPRLYNAADIFAYPGLGEFIGVVYLEAQACGTPVVAFANGGIPTVVIDGRTGLLTEPLDKGAFLGALRRLIDSPSVRSTMGQAGVEHIRRHHRRSDWGRRIAEVLEAASGPSSQDTGLN
jgi:glycosyltransferase involved in cell wall biosynthesis